MNTRADNQDTQFYEQLPRSIVEKLTLLTRRIRRIVLLRGLLIVAAAATGLLLALMSIDALVVTYSQGPRLALSLGSLLATLAVAWLALVRPLRRKHTLTAIARSLEIRHPELEERISSAIELLSSPDPAVIKGSATLIAELVRAAELDATAVEPRMEFTLRTAKPYLVAVSAMAGIVALLLLIWPASVARLLVRALVPYANVGNAFASALTVAPGNARIAFGDDLTVTATVRSRGVSRAELRRVGEDGVETVESMGRQPESVPGITVFSMRFASVAEGFRYRVCAGHGVTGYFLVRVDRRPDVERVKLVYEYPAYVGRPPRTEEGMPGDIAAPADTKIKLTAQFNKPVAVAELIVDGEAVGRPEAARAAAPPVKEKEWNMALTWGQAGVWSFKLVDDVGTTNQPTSFKLQATPDAIPTVAIVDPAEKTLKLKPTEIVPISYVARDDFGITAASMFVSIDSGKAIVIDLAPPARDGTNSDLWVGQQDLDLSALDLAQAKSVGVRVGVSDSLPPEMMGPQTGLSETVSIQLDQQAASLSQQAVASQDARIRAALAAARARLVQARGKAPDNAGEAVPKLPELREIRRLAGEAEEILRTVAEEAAGSPFAEISRPTLDIADRYVEPAGKLAELITLSDSAAEQGNSAASMRKDLDDAIAALDDLSKQLDQARENAQRLAELTDLASREEKLAQNAMELAKAKQPASLEEQKKWREAQDEMLKRIADLVKKDPGALDRQMEADQKAAQNLADAAKQLADQQKALADQGQKSESARKQQGDLAKAAEGLKNETGKLAEKMEKMGASPEDAKAKNAAEAQRSMESANASMKAAMDKMAPPQGQPGQPEPPKGAAPPPPAGAQKPNDEQQAAQQQAGQQLQKASDKLSELAKAMEGQMKAGANKAAKPGERKTPAAGAKTPNAGSPAPGKGAGSKGQGEGGGKPGSTPSPGEKKGGPPGPGGEKPGAPGGERPGPGSEAPDSGEALAKAFDKAADAASAESMAQAAPSAAQAAKQLDQLAARAAQKMGMKPGAPSSRRGGPPGQPNGGPPGGEPGQSPDGSGSPGAGEGQGGTVGSWLKAKGTLSGNVRDSSGENASSEYRDLVKSYFTSVAREGDKQK